MSVLADTSPVGFFHHCDQAPMQACMSAPGTPSGAAAPTAQWLWPSGSHWAPHCHSRTELGCLEAYRGLGQGLLLQEGGEQTRGKGAVLPAVGNFPVSPTAW